MVLHGVAGRGLVTLAAAAKIEGENGGGSGQARRNEPVEGVCVGRQPGREHERRPGPGVLEIVEPNAIRVDVAIAHVSSPSRRRYPSLISRRRVLPATFRGNTSSTTTSASFW